MAARPPRLGRVLGAGDRVAGVVLPRPVHRPRARDDHHVPGRRAAGAADRADEVEPLAAPEELRALERVRLGDPLVGVPPAVVDLLEFAHGRQPVVGELDAAHPAREEVARAVLADDMAGVDHSADAEVDRLRPRAAHRVGVDHEDRRVGQRRPRRRDERDVDEEAAVVLGDVDGERVADRVRQRGASRTSSSRGRVERYSSRPGAASNDE